MESEQINFTMGFINSPQVKPSIDKVMNCTKYNGKVAVKMAKILNAIVSTCIKQEALKNKFINEQTEVVNKEDGSQQRVAKNQAEANEFFHKWESETHSVLFNKVPLHELMQADLSPNDILALSFLIEEKL